MAPSLALEGYWPDETGLHDRDRARKTRGRSAAHPMKVTISSSAHLGKAVSAGPSRRQGSHAIKPQKSNAAANLPSAHRRHWGCRVEVPAGPSRLFERRAHPAQGVPPSPPPSGAASSPKAVRREAVRHEGSQLDEMDLDFDRDLNLEVSSLGSWSFDEESAPLEEMACEWPVLPPAPSPPLTPYMSRLSTPDLTPLATDFEFFPHWGYRQVEAEDKVGEAWYIAEKSKMDSQVEAALAHITRAQRGGRDDRDGQ